MFLFFAFDIAGFSRDIDHEAEMIDTVQTVFSRWASGRNLGDIKYELPVGDELIVVGEDTPSVAASYLRFITESSSLHRDGRKVDLRFALHHGPAVEVSVGQMLGHGRSASDNVLGNSVNVLSRLIAKARVGQVLASDTFHSRIQGFLSTKQLKPADFAASNTALHYDSYVLSIKHGFEVEAYNLLWRSDSADLGHPAPPQDSRFSGKNNYHSSFSYGPLLRLSEDQLFESYLGAVGENQFPLINSGRLFCRIPFELEYVHPSVATGLHVIVETSSSDSCGRFVDEEIVSNFKLYRSRNEHRYEEAELAAIESLEVSPAGVPVRLRLRKVTYADVVSTDLSPDFAFPQGAHWVTAREHTFGPIAAGGLSPLGTNPRVPDAVGTATEVITSDGYLFHPLRSQRVHSHPGTYTSGASGAVDWMDVDDRTLQAKLKHVFEEKLQLEQTGVIPWPLAWSAARELRDELGIASHQINYLGFLGIGRELLRLAKPTFFFVAHIDLTLAGVLRSMKSADENWEWNFDGALPRRSVRLSGDESLNRKVLLAEVCTGAYNPVAATGMFLLTRSEGALEWPPRRENVPGKRDLS